MDADFKRRESRDNKSHGQIIKGRCHRLKPISLWMLLENDSQWSKVFPTKRAVPMPYPVAPLSDPHKQIRLLFLHDGGFYDEIRADTSVWNRNNAPTYHAISYTWGQPTDTASVTIDGHERKVRENCAYALWQARLHRPNSYIWIDSICINQDDNVEKSAQVNDMYDIYVRSKSVLACIGKADESSKYLSKILPDLNARVPDMDECRRWSTRAYDGRERFNMHNHHAIGIHLERWHPDVNVESLARLVRCFNALDQRAYFGRAWILQELCGGKGCTIICCGSRTFEWTDLHEFGRRLSKFNRLLRKAGSSVVENRITQIGKLLTSDFKGAFGRSFESDNWGKVNAPLELLLHLGPRLCADPRDRIYAVLPLVNQHRIGTARLVPDYDIPIWRLALQAAQWLSDRQDFWSVCILARALKLENDASATLSHLFEEPGDDRYDARKERRLPHYSSRACQIYTSETQSLYAQLRHYSEASHLNASKTSSAEASSTGSQAELMPLLDSQHSLPVFSESRIAALVCPQTLPGDLLIKSEVLGHLILRPTGKVHTYAVVGKARIMPGYELLDNSGDWFCECSSALPDEAKRLCGLGVGLSIREFLYLAISECASDADRLLLSPLSVPIPGTLVRLLDNKDKLIPECLVSNTCPRHGDDKGKKGDLRE